MADTAVASSTVNPDLRVLHGQLVALAAEIDAAVGRAATAGEVTALLDELADVNARVTNVGRQLFTQQTARITAGVAKVAEGHEAAMAAVRKLDSIKAVVDGVTKFLGMVDKVVDIAKLVV